MQPQGFLKDAPLFPPRASEMARDIDTLYFTTLGITVAVNSTFMECSRMPPRITAAAAADSGASSADHPVSAALWLTDRALISACEDSSFIQNIFPRTAAVASRLRLSLR